MASRDFSLIDDIINDKQDDNHSRSSNFNVMINRFGYVSILPEEKKVLTKLLSDYILIDLIPFVHSYLIPNVTLIQTSDEIKSRSVNKMIWEQVSLINNQRNGITKGLMLLTRQEAEKANNSNFISIDDNKYKLLYTAHYLHNELHRIDGPAMVIEEGNRRKWYRNGKLHRIDGPATIDNTVIEWFFNGKIHKDQSNLSDLDDPAMQIWIINKFWLIYGKRHRENNPAVIHGDDYESWYLYGFEQRKQ